MKYIIILYYTALCFLIKMPEMFFNAADFKVLCAPGQMIECQRDFGDDGVSYISATDNCEACSVSIIDLNSHY